MKNNQHISNIKAYHDTLFKASVSGFDEKIPLTAMIALLSGKNYKKFTSDYRSLILNDPNNKPIKKLVDLAEEYFKTLGVDSTFQSDVFSKWDALTGQDKFNKVAQGQSDIRIIMIIESFIKNCLIYINPSDITGTGDFLGAMFAEITAEGGEAPKGIVLTPKFLTDFMTDLEELDYRKDTLIDAACGSGSFLTMAYLKMYASCEKDFTEGKITPEEHAKYLKRLSQSVYGNDIDVRMALLTMTNFALLGIDLQNVTYKDCFSLDQSFFDDRHITKAILNPPFEYAPAHFMTHIIERIHNVDIDTDKKFIMICPPQAVNNGKVISNTKKGGKLYENFLTKTLNLATLDAVIEVQANAFQESNINIGTSIFVFNLNKAHENDDRILYYDFTNTGYEYFKNSGLVDKYNVFAERKNLAIKNIKNKGQYQHKNTRTWTTFYDIPNGNNFEITIDKNKIAMQDVEETDLTKANQEIKTILKEKQELIDSVGNVIPATEEFEDYLVQILSEVR